jgi:hypothetical protein
MSSAAKLASTVGLLLAVIGAGLIWKFGLPMDVDREGRVYRITTEVDHQEMAKARRYDRRSGFGFALIIAGFILQALGLYL